MITRIFQAELIRILLFGRGSGNGELYYPFVPKANDNYVNCVSAPICHYEGTFELFIVMYLCGVCGVWSVCSVCLLHFIVWLVWEDLLSTC